MILRPPSKLAAGAGCALLVVVVVLGIRLAPYLPPPAGPFQVGTVLWDTIAPVRALLCRAGCCPLSVQLWYPAEPGTGDGLAPYRPEGAALLSAARWVRTGAILNAALSSHQVRYPVLVSLPGWAGCAARTPRSCRIWPAVASSLRGSVMMIRHVRAWIDRLAIPAATDMDFSSQAAFEHTLGVAHQKIERVAEGGLAHH